MERFCLSKTFETLNDIETGVYLEGSAYVYELLKKEAQSRERLRSVWGEKELI